MKKLDQIFAILVGFAFIVFGILGLWWLYQSGIERGTF
jgi:hypothetical protein